MRVSLFLLFISFSTVVFAQDKVAEKTIQKFLIDFNSAKYDDIYGTFSSGFKLKMTKEETTKYLSKIHDMIDGFKSAEFKFMQDRNFYYLFSCKDKNINADFLCSINLDGKFDYLTFKRIGGSGNPPIVGKLKQ